LLLLADAERQHVDVGAGFLAANLFLGVEKEDHAGASL
jgi:hypothetical protein